MSPDPEPTSLEARVAVLSERLDRYWENAQAYVAESRADRAHLHQLLDDPRRSQALMDREGVLTTVAATYVRQDLYEARHRELVGLVDDARTTATREHLADEATIKLLTDRVVLLEKGSAALLARYAVLGGLAIIIFAAVISVTVDKVTR